MDRNLKDRWSIPVTAVANEFIDRYMAGASGEYVKVYLYVLRHQEGEMTIDMIADGLNHTESDVRRALAYWQRLGVISQAKEGGRDRGESGENGQGEGWGSDSWPSETAQGQLEPEQETAATGVEVRLETSMKEPVHSQDPVNRLAQDEAFSQLLYIAQKYMNRVFTPRDCQVFAYLYEDLGMNGELLEYLVEYCVQNGHSSVRYIEAVALKWHEREIKTVGDAKLHSASYNQDSFAVMKAFGLNGRKPALPEQQLMDKWFKKLGFSRDLVLEACSRTITAIHNPSFQYTDKILSDWNESGVKSLADVEALDAKRNAEKEAGGQKGEKETSRQEGRRKSFHPGSRPGKGAPNQFHNFEQRDTDYDELMLKQVREWVGQQS